MIDEIHLSLEEILSIKQDLREVANIPNTIPFSAYYSYMAWQEDLDNIPLSPKYLDFTKNRYSESGVPCGVGSISNFTRLTSATMWQDGQLVEVANNMPRISGEGLLIEPQRTNHMGSKDVSGSAAAIAPQDFSGYTYERLSAKYIAFGRGTFNMPTKPNIFSIYSDTPEIPATIYFSSTDGYKPATISDGRIFRVTEEAESIEPHIVRDAVGEILSMPQLENGSIPSSYIPMSLLSYPPPTTRSPDILIIDVEPNQYISGDWDEGVAFEQFSGYAKFSGHGYIRNIEVLDLQGRPAQ